MTTPYNPTLSHKKWRVAEVRWGDQTWEEMMVGFFDVAVPPKADLAKVLARQ